VRLRAQVQVLRARVQAQVLQAQVQVQVLRATLHNNPVVISIPLRVRAEPGIGGMWTVQK